MLHCLASWKPSDFVLYYEGANAVPMACRVSILAGGFVDLYIENGHITLAGQ